MTQLAVRPPLDPLPSNLYRPSPPTSSAVLWAMFLCFAVAASPAWAWTQLQGEHEGVLTTRTYVDATHGSVAFQIYTPPGYFSPGNVQRYPVLYFLHGSGEDETAFAAALSELPTAGNTGPEKVDSAILSGLLPPMIWVAVGAPGGSWTEALGRMVSEDLVDHVDRNWRTVADRRGRSLEGFSAGAQAVARYLTPRPQRFASTSILGGGFENYRWADQVEAVRVRGLRVNILSGDADQFLAGAQELHALLIAEGIDSQFETLSGVPHNLNLIYKTRGLENLQFHAAAWAAESVVEAGADQVLSGGAPASVSLGGEVLDGGTYTTQWTQIGGPAQEASFTNGFAPNSSVTFHEIGTYALAFTASDAQGSYDDVMVVSVVDLDDSLAMHLPLDVDAVDATGNGNDGVEEGATAVSSGKIGGAYRFDGVDDRIRIADFSYGPSFSFAFWFQADGLAGSSYQYMLSHNGFDAAHSLNVYLPENSTSANGHVRSVMRDADDGRGRYIDAAGSFDDGAWHHFALVVDNVDSRVYVDGEEAVVSAQGGDAFDPGTDLYLGGRSVSPSGRYFDGRLDDVRLYSRRLEPAEIQALGGIPGSDLAPTVDAGADVAIGELEDVVLQGLVTDDGLSSLTATWSQVSGPGTATFSHAADASTSVTFDAAGTYVLRLTATDSQGSAYDELTVAIQAANDPVGHWLLNETSGLVAADESVQGNDGALQGSSGPTWTGGGLSFEASDSQAVILGRPESLDLKPAQTDISLVAWIKVEPGAEGTLIGKAYGSLTKRQYQLYLYDNDNDGRTSVYGLIGGVSNNNAKFELVDDGEWHLVAVVHDAETMKNRMYVDGLPVGSWKNSGSATNAVDVTLGARRHNSNNTGTAWALDGEIGEARIYAWALSDTEMAALHAAGVQ